jgi:hypothetical protein
MLLIVVVWVKVPQVKVLLVEVPLVVVPPMVVDVITVGSGAVTFYVPRKANVEVLDNVLCVKGASNILQENLFTIMLSLEIIASSHFFASSCRVLVIPLAERKYSQACTPQVE